MENTHPTRSHIFQRFIIYIYVYIYINRIFIIYTYKCIMCIIIIQYVISIYDTSYMLIVYCISYFYT